MDNLELFYDHYKETFVVISEQTKQRDKKFVLVFILLFILLLFTFNPIEYSNIIFNFINEQYLLDLSNQFSVIQTFLWLALFYETLRYSQLMVYIEREYKYIDYLEEQITELSKITFNREGKDYTKNYKSISKFTNFCYKYFFPLFSLVVASLKIKSEYSTPNILCFLIIDTVIFVGYFILWSTHSYYVIKYDI